MFNILIFFFIFLDWIIEHSTLLSFNKSSKSILYTWNYFWSIFNLNKLYH
nr:MAG TPA: hypothetical protein [Crassvirales sp.]